MNESKVKTCLLVLSTLSAGCVGSVGDVSLRDGADDTAVVREAETSVTPPIDAEPIDAERGVVEDPVDSAPSVADTAPPKKTVGLFAGVGAGAEYVSAVAKALADDARFVLTKFSDGAADFGEFDVVIVPGGSASAEWSTLGSAGQSKLLKFVSGGGGYVGICAGFYLALPGMAGLIPAKFYEPWARGDGQVDVALEPKHPMFSLGGTLRFRYLNGPIVHPIDLKSPGYTVLARFATNIGGSEIVSMVGKPAVVAASYGTGRVVAFSPHPELSGLGQLLKDSLLWAAR